LWNDEYPIKLKDRFPILLNGVAYFNHYLILDAARNVIPWAVDFEKEKELRFSIIVASANKGKGLGTKLIEKLKSENTVFYGWVIDHDKNVKQNGESYQSPLSFYVERGFGVLQNERIDSEMISAVKIKWAAKT
jgi:hypothetical protein